MAEGEGGGTVPREWQERVFHMLDAWTDPGQVLAADIRRWRELLEDAEDAIQYEIVIEPSETTRRLLAPGLARALRDSIATRLPDAPHPDSRST